MIFGVFILVLAAAVAFFHYVQGFFSALISAIIVILAAAIALGFHENLAALAFSSFAPAQGYGLSLVLLFTVIYIVLRVLFDKLVPGNIHVPVLADKIGAGVFGVVAGIFGGGILAIAAQTLPFGPAFGGYARFDVEDRQAQGVRVPGKNQLQDIPVAEELKLDDTSIPATTIFSPDGGYARSLMLPVDDWTIGLVAHLSDGGALAGARPFSAVHPAYLNEMFAQRLGIQVGAKRIMPADSGSSLKVERILTSDSIMSALKVADLEVPEIRGKGRFDPAKPVEGTILVLRLRPANSGADADGYTRFSPASVRLVSSLGADGEPRRPVNYYPIGTVVGGQTLARNLPDDPLFLKAGKAVDLVFAVDKTLLTKPAAGQGLVFPEGSFIEFKRLARADLSGKPVEVSTSIESKEDVGVLTRSAAQ